MNYYWMFWIGGISWRFSASSFCDFWNTAFCNFTAFSSFRKKQHFDFCFMCFMRRTIAYICPNINFDVVDFSECRSEEVISFFWRSVYVGFIDAGRMYEFPLSCTLRHVFFIKNKEKKIQSRRVEPQGELSHLKRPSRQWCAFTSITCL